MQAILAGIAVWVLGGMGAVLLSRFPRVASALGGTSAVLGALLGLPTTAGVLLVDSSEAHDLPWDAIHGDGVQLDAGGRVPALILA
jgi:hypothetical protein